MRNICRTTIVPLATACALLLVGGVAYAYWTANGSGAAAAQAGSVAPVNASVTTIGTSGTLYPGTSVAATINVHNPNAVGVIVQGFTVTAASQPTGLAGATNVGGPCTTANSLITASGATASGLSVSVPAGGDVTISSATGTISMGGNSANGCQGAQFTFSAVSVNAIVG